MHGLTMCTQEEAIYWLSLAMVHGVGSQTYCQLLKVFGHPEAVYHASYHALCEVVTPKIAQQIVQGVDQKEIQPTLDWLMQDSNHLITLADSRYPVSLLEITDPPPILYAKGNLDVFEKPGIAMVGSRSATPQGEANAVNFAKSLCEAGYCIISGMALGIDGAAHRGALQATGATIAVVGTGLDIVYPARHRDLAHKILAKGGLIVSEFPLGTPSRAQNFPRRNRIISGLSLGCLVVEANLQSGSLITARFAAEQGRDVFAIPGSIHSPVAKGCHLLIKQGAKLVDSIQDIVDEFNHVHPLLAPLEQVNDDSDTLQELMNLMGYDPITIEALTAMSHLTIDAVSAMLLTLELEGKVALMPGGRYQRIH